MNSFLLILQKKTLIQHLIQIWVPLLKYIGIFQLFLISFLSTHYTKAFGYHLDNITFMNKFCMYFDLVAYGRNTTFLVFLVSS